MCCDRSLTRIMLALFVLRTLIPSPTTRWTRFSWTRARSTRWHQFSMYVLIYGEHVRTYRLPPMPSRFMRAADTVPVRNAYSSLKLVWPSHLLHPMQAPVEEAAGAIHQCAVGATGAHHHAQKELCLPPSSHCSSAPQGPSAAQPPRVAPKPIPSVAAGFPARALPPSMQQSPKQQAAQALNGRQPPGAPAQGTTTGDSEEERAMALLQAFGSADSRANSIPTPPTTSA